MNRTIKLDISYFGATFAGFARQPGLLTVQGNLEEALAKVFDHETQTTCAGRTDAGVHAKHQFVSFEISEDETSRFSNLPNKLKKSLESLTHDDIHILDVEILEHKFSARFDAKMRKYSYFICAQPHAPLLMRDFSWHIYKKLDLCAMKKAATYLEGEHDFKSFCVASSAKDKPTSRFIHHINLLEHNVFGEHIIEIQVHGNAFLHSMVRTIVGSLVKVGAGHREPEWIKEVLAAKNRQAAGDCAPAKALILMDVEY